MSDWLTAAEIAALALPGMPATKQGVNKVATRDRWRARGRKGSGGGREYHVSNLPGPARIALMSRRFKDSAQQVVERAAATVEAATAPVLSNSAAATLRRDARLLILEMFQAFQRELMLPKVRAQRLFAELYSSVGASGDGRFDLTGTTYELTVPAWMRAERPTVSAASLQRWAEMRARGEIGALAGRHGNRKGSSLLDTHKGIHDFVVGALIGQPTWGAPKIRDAIVAEFGETVEVADEDGEVRQMPVPTLRSIQRWMATWRAEHEQTLARETDPDAWKNGYRVSVGNASESIRRLNQVWEIDASPTDLLLTDGRYTLYAALDIYSRRVVTFISRTAKTEASLLLIRKAIGLWGMPETIRTDNGSDFISRAFKATVALLNITHDICPPFSPERKGFVERAIGTVNHGFMPLQPGFIGHSVADRKKIEARKSFAQRLGTDAGEAFAVELTRDELQARLDDWCAYKYGHEPHAGLRGQTPFQAAIAYDGEIRRVEDEQALALLLAPAASSSGRPAGLRTVSKAGIRVEDAAFWADELVAWMRRDVFVRLDPEDMGKVWIFTPDHARFICCAENVERSGLSRSELAASAHAAQREYMREQRAKLTRSKRAFSAKKMATAIVEDAKDRASGVIPFPRPSEHVDTPALRAASAALASANEPAVPAARQDVDPAAHAAVVAEFEAARAARAEETDRQRFRRWLQLDARIQAGDGVTESDQRWHRVYRTTPEFLGLQMAYEEWGDEALGGA